MPVRANMFGDSRNLTLKLTPSEYTQLRTAAVCRDLTSTELLVGLIKLIATNDPAASSVADKVSLQKLNQNLADRAARGDADVPRPVADEQDYDAIYNLIEASTDDSKTT